MKIKIIRMQFKRVNFARQQINKQNKLVSFLSKQHKLTNKNHCFDRLHKCHQIKQK